MKQYSKRALQADSEKQGNFVESDKDSNYSGSYGDSNDSNADGSDMSDSDEEDELEGFQGCGVAGSGWES